jgi:carboxypeptidase Q
LNLATPNPATPNRQLRFAPMKHIALAVALLAAVSLSAQETLQRNAERIAAAALTSNASWETLEHLSDSIGPRLSGSVGADLAVRWTTERFRSWGIDVRNEPVKVPRWIRGDERARLVSHNEQKIVVTALGGSVATPRSGITAEVIEVTSFDQLAVLGRAKLAGKIVFFHSSMDRSLVEAGHAFDAYSKAVGFRGTGASRAAEYGAVAVVIRSVASDSLRTPHTGSLRYDEKHPKIPAAAMTEEDAMLVHRLLARGERVRMNLVLTPRTLADKMSANVVAEIRGSVRPDEIVLIGAHLDSWDLGTGAIDNGSGVAMVMETMRVIKTLGLTPRRTIRCVLFMNEENGLRGGRGYFEAYKADLANHVATIESDAGVAAPDRFLTTLNDAQRQKIAALTEPVFARIGPIRFDHSESTGADTSPLTRAGVPGFGHMPDGRLYFHYHHTPADTLDKVDPKHLAQNTASIAALTWLIADSDITFR